MLTFYMNQRQANEYWPDYLTMSILWFRLYHFNEFWFSLLHVIHISACHYFLTLTEAQIAL